MRKAHIRDKAICPDEIKDLLVQSQRAMDTVRFCLEKSPDGVDLTGDDLVWYLVFKNDSGTGESVVLDKSIGEALIFLDWVPGLAATSQAGRLQIQIYCAKAEDNTIIRKWVSKPVSIRVEEALDPSAIVLGTPTLLEQYLATFQTMKNATEGYKNTAFSSAGTATLAKNDAITAKNDAITAKTAAETAKDAAESARDESVSAKDDSVAAKNASEGAKDEAVRAEAAAKGFRNEALAVAGVGNHVRDVMPHQCQVGNTWYKWGLAITASGKVQFKYEEVV